MNVKYTIFWTTSEQKRVPIANFVMRGDQIVTFEYINDEIINEMKVSLPELIRVSVVKKDGNAFNLLWERAPTRVRRDTENNKISREEVFRNFVQERNARVITDRFDLQLA